jgi:peptidoglycan/xylan/chitin deacetylase (PgdA/CDA1 family)
MIATVQRLVRGTDGLLARAYLALFRERGGLLAFLFHSLFRDDREIDLDLVDPLQRTTVPQFRTFLEYYLGQGYRFVTPDEVAGGLEPGGKYALVSFDDGYYNNVLALPVLAEYRVPAVFFIATEHVRQGKCFWWDVLYRERVARGASRGAIHREGLSMKANTTGRIEAELRAAFGPGAFTPRGDIDRPFTPAELREFARSPWVHLGNHTADHAILTNYGAEEVREQVLRAQESLAEMTGVRPTSIAYPNGGHNDPIVRACGELGLKIGFTITPVKNRVPGGAGSPAALRLGRFAPHDEIAMETQCRTYRSDLLLYSALRAGYLRTVRGYARDAV